MKLMDGTEMQVPGTEMQTEIQRELFRNQDEKYRYFQAKLLPTVDSRTVIGVRTPPLRAFARRLYKEQDRDEDKESDFSDFLHDLPHKYFDENQLHAFLIAEIKDFDLCMAEVNRFLPFVDNWATCDQMSPKVFGKHKEELLTQIKIWLLPEQAYTDKAYTVRFAVGMLMRHFLDEDFDVNYPKLVLQINLERYPEDCPEGYYVKMMVAWYFATALARQYQAVLPFLENGSLEKWTHNKAIQKACESYRISDEQKKYLRTLKIK